MSIVQFGKARQTNREVCTPAWEACVLSETDELKRIQLRLARTSTLFRNNVALAWVGNAAKLRNGDVLIRNARPMHAGLVVGSSDLIGWTPVVIRPEHVGKTLAVFTAIEGKSERGQIQPEQSTFIKNVNAAGGIAFVARSAAEAESLVQRCLGFFVGVIHDAADLARNLVGASAI
jgi:hypothetical protein